MWWQSETCGTDTRSDQPVASHRLRLIIFVIAIPFLYPPGADAASFTVAGETFSDDLGGFVLERVSGQGSTDDPFVVVERMTGLAGGTLEFQIDRAFGNRIGSHHAWGFALIKVIENATDFRGSPSSWSFSRSSVSPATIGTDCRLRRDHRLVDRSPPRASVESQASMNLMTGSSSMTARFRGAGRRRCGLSSPRLIFWPRLT